VAVISFNGIFDADGKVANQVKGTIAHAEEAVATMAGLWDGEMQVTGPSQAPQVLQHV
jgi:hypothetical protein